MLDALLKFVSTFFTFRTLIYYMRKFRLLAVLTVVMFLGKVSVAQDPVVKNKPVLQKPSKTQIDCSSQVSMGDACNFISNKSFTPIIQLPANRVLNPFNAMSLIPSWEASHGTPDLVNGNLATVVQPPSPANGLDFMYATNDANTQDISEGIVQRIPALTTNHNYVLSFFKRRPLNPGLTLNHFYIELMKCADFAQIQNDLGFITPVIPAGTNHQTIYCETSVMNPGWEQVVVQFTATSPYDVIWFYPQQDLNGSTQGVVGLNVSSPELIDVTGFTAGLPPSPAPVPPNCNVTIGPATNNCGVLNAVFRWHKPDGSLYTTIPSGQNQQINIDGSIPSNAGNWTLRMDVPGTVTTSNTCSQPLNVFASVNVPLCTNSVWPKEYGTLDGVFSLVNAYNGNFIMAPHNIINSLTFYNHVGVFPTNPNSLTELVHYNLNGVTNWLVDYNDPLAGDPIFSFRSGIVQMSGNNGTYYFIDGSTGLTVSPPINIPGNEQIIVETINGSIITQGGGVIPSLKVYVNGTNVSTVSLPNVNINLVKYNLATNDLFVIGTNMINFQPELRKYHFDGANLGLTFFSIISAIPPLYGTFIDNQNSIYFIDANGVLNKYDYLNSPPNILPVVMPGFNNQNLTIQNFPRRYNYTENKILLYNEGDNFLYLIDFESMIAKKVITTNLSPHFIYQIDQGNLILNGFLNYQTQIGNQILPNFSQMGAPIYITKLNLQTDFEFQRESPITEAKALTPDNSLNVLVSPNPATTSLQLKISEKENNSFSAYSVTISNQMGKAFLQKNMYFSGNSIDISSLKTGVYFITVTNKQGQNKSVIFSKL
jgi:hypothetical protein